MGWKCFSRGSFETIPLRPFVRWVLKGSFEGFGWGGWISRVCGVECAGGVEEGGGFWVALDDDEWGARAGCGAASSARLLGGGEEGTSDCGPSVLGGKGNGAIGGGRFSTAGFSDGVEEEASNRSRFAGGEACRVGEGELEANGRLREGELGTSGGPKGERVG